MRRFFAAFLMLLALVPAAAQDVFNPATVAPVTPQLRLSFATATPVMAATVSGATSHFCTPFAGPLVPIYNGSSWVNVKVGELSQTTADSSKSPAIAASKLYDIFVWNDAGTIRCTRGTAWASDSARTDALVRVDGIWLNSVQPTGGPAIQRGTWIGTIRTNGSSTLDYTFGAAASGGTAAFLGLCNYYNRVSTTTTVTDNGASYNNYTSATIRQARNSVGNQVTFVQCQQEDGVIATLNATTSTLAALSAFTQVGVGYDSVTTFASDTHVDCNDVVATVSTFCTGSSTFMTLPTIGVHVLSSNQKSDGTNGNTFDVNSTDALIVTVRN